MSNTVDMLCTGCVLAAHKVLATLLASLEAVSFTSFINRQPTQITTSLGATVTDGVLGLYTLSTGLTKVTN